MRILILGSEGFIGNHCVDFFHSRGWNVYGCDLLDLKEPTYTYFKISRLRPDFTEVFQKEKFDVCINAAGNGSVPFSMNHPFSDFEANTIDTFTVLEAIRLHNPRCKYINLSSAAVYGNPRKLPIHEDDPIIPLSPYGWHKYYSELVCNEYNTLYGIQTCSLRPFSVYGPGLKKQLFWDIYQKTLKSKSVVLFGTGNESRDFIYITDLILGIWLIVQKSEMKGEVYNISSGNETSIREVSDIFATALGGNVSFAFNGEERAGDPINWRADITKISALQFRAEVDLQSGLKNYADWLLNKP